MHQIIKKISKAIYNKKNIATMVFVYDHSLLAKQIACLKSLCEKIANSYSIAYSYKTNPLLALYIYKEGCSMQVASLRQFQEISKFVNSKNLQKCFFNTASLTKDAAVNTIASATKR